MGSTHVGFSTVKVFLHRYGLAAELQAPSSWQSSPGFTGHDDGGVHRLFGSGANSKSENVRHYQRKCFLLVSSSGWVSPFFN